MTDEQKLLKNEDDQEISLLVLLQVLVKRKMTIVAICGITLLASLGASFLLPDIYSATAKILPPQKESSGGLSALLGQAGALAGLAGISGVGSSGDLYLGILKSRTVADAIIARLELAKVYRTKTPEAARKKLDEAVKMQAGKDGIISIVSEDKDPKRAALLANAFVDELGKTTIRLNLSKAGTERLFLEKRLELVKKDLKTAEDALKDFAQGHKIVQVDAQAKASIEGIARLKAELVSKEVQLSVLSSNQTEESPEVRAAHTGISRLRGELSALAGSDGSAAGIPSLGNVPNLGLEYSRRLRELKTQEAIFEQLTKQHEMAKLNEAKDSSSFQVLDEAVAPVTKSKPSRSLIVILATITAFLVSLFVIYAQEFLSQVSDEEREIIENIKKQALNFR